MIHGGCNGRECPLGIFRRTVVCLLTEDSLAFWQHRQAVLCIVCEGSSVIAHLR